jgi:hypothetical protein
MHNMPDPRDQNAMLGGAGGGLLSAARRATGGGGGMPQMPSPQTPPINPQQQPPQMGGMDMSGSPFMQAFSQNPQFQQQLMAMMQGQSPGFRPPSFMPMPK